MELLIFLPLGSDPITIKGGTFVLTINGISITDGLDTSIVSFKIVTARGTQGPVKGKTKETAGETGPRGEAGQRGN